MTQYAIAVDCNRCVGCMACNGACKMVNNVPIGSFWNKVLRIGPQERGVGEVPSHDFYMLPVQCQHCADPECVKVCPTQALQLPQSATPENTILGIADLDTDLCLAYRLIGCRFCYDACEYDAIELDENNRPYVIDDKCNGCGACESVCVSMQNGSITAGANRRAIIVEPVK